MHPIYGLNYYPGIPNFNSVLLYDWSFPGKIRFLVSPYGTIEFVKKSLKLEDSQNFI